MALSDPFSTVYQGQMAAQPNLGQGVSGIADTVGANLEKQKQMKMAHDILKQTGQLTEENTPPSVDELKSTLQSAGKQLGANVQFNIPEGTSEDDQRKQLAGLYKSYGIPMPQGNNKVTYHLQPGTSWTPGTGALSMKGEQKQFTPLEQVQQMQQAQQLLQTSGISGKDVSTSPKGVSIKSPSGAVKDIGGTAKTILQGIQEGKLPPTLSGMSRTAGLSAAIEVEAQKQGFDLKQAQLDYKTMEQKSRTAGGAPVMRMSTAVGTLDQSLNELDRLNEEYKRTDMLPAIANRIKINTDKQGVASFGLDSTKGLDGTQQQQAMKYLYQLNNTLDMQALVYSGGFAPQEWAYKMAAGSMSPYYGTEATKAVTGQARKDIQMRVNAANQFFGSKQIQDIHQQGQSGQMLQATGLAPQQGQQQSQSQFTPDQIAAEIKRRGLK